MDKAIKILGTLIVIVLLSYLIYRNIMLHFIPSSDLVKDESTSALYNKMQPNTTNKEWLNYYFSHNKVTAYGIPEEMKYNIAFKATGLSSNKITEKELREGYERIFGLNSYVQTDSFMAGCNLYEYDSRNSTYINNERKICDKNDISIISKIVDAKERNGSFDITVVIAYMDNSKKIIYKTCNSDMTNCSEELESNYTDFDEANLDKYKNKLHKYKFKYKLTNGEYFFTESQKLK